MRPPRVVWLSLALALVPDPDRIPDRQPSGIRTDRARFAPQRFPTSPLILCLRMAEGLNTTTRRGEIGTSLPVSHAPAFLANNKQAERLQLYLFATLQAVRDFFENEFDECGAFGSRQASLFINRLV